MKATCPPQRREGVSIEVRNAVQQRARFCCERCGVSLGPDAGQVHHRQPRAMGGSRRPEVNAPQNLVLLCLGCHMWTESRRKQAYLAGWLVRTGFDPANVPILHALHGWVLLLPDGGWCHIEGDEPDYD